MKYAGMPFGMWALFAGSFQKQLTAVLGYDAATAKAITKKAKPQYRQIIAGLPEFEKADRFKMNIVNCAMLGAFILSMPQRPEVDRLTDYYAKSMMTKPMQWFCRKSGKSKFTPKDIAAMKATAALKAADRNPYSWNMEFYEYPDGSGYEGRFTKCGICVLMSGNVLHNSMWTAAGAITSAIALSETFNALSQGVVEMQENPYDMINAKELTILGTRHQYQKFPEVVKILPDHLKEVDEITTHVFKAEDFQKAFDTLADRNSGAGKVVLTFA